MEIGGSQMHVALGGLLYWSITPNAHILDLVSDDMKDAEGWVGHIHI